MRTITACTLDCPDTCSLVVEKTGSGKVIIRGNPNHPYTAGFTCSKIKRYPARLADPDRITSPLLRRGKAWLPISWADALNLCAEKIDALREEPGSILLIDGHGYKGLLAKVPRWFFAQIGGARADGSLCDQAGMDAYEADFGEFTQHDHINLLKSKRIVNWGRDLSRSSVHFGAIIRKAGKNGIRILTVSPGGDGNAGFSDRLITVRPGADRFLAAAAIKILADSGRVPENPGAVSSNWDSFRDYLDTLSLPELLDRCQVSRADLETLARWYAPADDTATVLGWGLQRHRFGGENVRYINALALVSGNMGRPGGGSYFGIASSRNYAPGLLPINDGPSPGKFMLPTIARDIAEADDPPVGLMWVTSNNIVNQAPDSRAIAQAFAKVPFKVVVEGFMTDTAQRADLVLPAALTLEQEDLVAACGHDYINYVRPAFDPPGEARSDYWILSRLGRKLSPPVVVPGAEEIMASALESPFVDFTLEEIRERGFSRSLRPKVAFEGAVFSHPDGKHRCPGPLHPEPEPPAGYPLRLLSLVRRRFMHSQIPKQDQSAPPQVWLSPDNPAWGEIDPQKPVYLATPLGRIQVRPEKSKGIHPAAVIYRRGDWMMSGGGVNQLIQAELTDMGNLAAYYSQCARLEN